MMITNTGVKLQW